MARRYKQATTIVPTLDSTPKTEADEIDIPRPRKRTSDCATIIEAIAGKGWHHKNWQFPKAHEFFPNEPHLRYVDRYYQTSKHGALLFDEPAYPGDMQECRRKKQVMHQLGLKYAIVTSDMNEFDVCQQLGIKHAVDNEHK